MLPAVRGLRQVRHANHVTGIDIAPQMIEQDKQLNNLSWQVGDAFAHVLLEPEYEHCQLALCRKNDLTR